MVFQFSKQKQGTRISIRLAKAHRKKCKNSVFLLQLAHGKTLLIQTFVLYVYDCLIHLIHFEFLKYIHMSQNVQSRIHSKEQNGEAVKKW